MNRSQWTTWASEHRWLLLLIYLVVLVLFDSLELETRSARSIGIVGFGILFLGVAATIDQGKRPRVMMAAFVLLWFGLILINQFAAYRSLDAVISLLSGILLFGTLAVGFRQLFAPVLTEYERLLSGVFSYIVLAVVWGFIYWRIEISVPGSFRFPYEDMAEDSSTFLYYSMVTMTSLGYGDITPVTAIARMLAGLQAIAGVMFIAIFIGRSVSRLR